MTSEEIAQYAGFSLAGVRAAIQDRAINGATTHPRSPDHWMVHRDEGDRWVATVPETEH